MKSKAGLPGKITFEKIIFIVTVFASVYWWLSQAIDVYQHKLVGIVFEILWFPAIAALFLIPIISLILWAKQKFTLKSFHPFSITLGIITLLALILKS